MPLTTKKALLTLLLFYRCFSPTICRSSALSKNDCFCKLTQKYIHDMGEEGSNYIQFTFNVILKFNLLKSMFQKSKNGAVFGANDILPHLSSLTPSNSKLNYEWNVKGSSSSIMEASWGQFSLLLSPFIS